METLGFLTKEMFQVGAIIMEEWKFVGVESGVPCVIGTPLMQVQPVNNWDTHAMVSIE